MNQDLRFEIPCPHCAECIRHVIVLTPGKYHCPRCGELLRPEDMEDPNE